MQSDCQLLLQEFWLTKWTAFRREWNAFFCDAVGSNSLYISHAVSYFCNAQYSHLGLHLIFISKNWNFDQTLKLNSNSKADQPKYKIMFNKESPPQDFLERLWSVWYRIFSPFSSLVVLWPKTDVIKNNPSHIKL